MPKDLVGKVREQPAHDGLEAFWASGCVQSLALVLSFGPGLRILSTWQDRWWYWASRGSCEAGYIKRRRRWHARCRRVCREEIFRDVPVGNCLL